jgi:hypothetical protein
MLVDSVQSHQQLYGGGGGGAPASSGAMGSAAAMQGQYTPHSLLMNPLRNRAALKTFSGGGSGGSSGGNSQNAFVGMAMGEASKLFDSQSSAGNVASGASKESAVQQAGEMALKMYMQSQGGGSGGGGVSSLMGLASKFF